MLRSLTTPAVRQRHLSLAARLAQALGMRRQRLALGRLDAHLLRDIGLSAREAQAEAERPFWDAPDHWRR